VLLKREDLQPVFSFKLRGAYNRIAHLSEASARRGVVCASAGNHAQGVALAARRRGITAVIVMPQTTPHIKVQAVIDLGAEVVIHGDDYDSAFEQALQLARERNLVFVHPFDDPDVIAGQGPSRWRSCARAAATWMRSSCRSAAAGCSRHRGIRQVPVPGREVIGVEPQDAASMHDSLKAGRRITLERVGIFADGVAVRRVGEETFALCRGHVDEIVLLGTDEICAAIQDVFETRARSSSRPARWRSPGSRSTRHAKAGAASAWWRSTAART